MHGSNPQEEFFANDSQFRRKQTFQTDRKSVLVQKTDSKSQVLEVNSDEYNNRQNGLYQSASCQKLQDRKKSYFHKDLEDKPSRREINTANSNSSINNGNDNIPTALYYEQQAERLETLLKDGDKKCFLKFSKHEVDRIKTKLEEKLKLKDNNDGKAIKNLNSLQVMGICLSDISSNRNRLGDQSMIEMKQAQKGLVGYIKGNFFIE